MIELHLKEYGSDDKQTNYCHRLSLMFLPVLVQTINLWDLGLQSSALLHWIPINDSAQQHYMKSARH